MLVRGGHMPAGSLVDGLDVASERKPAVQGDSTFGGLTWSDGAAFM